MHRVTANIRAQNQISTGVFDPALKCFQLEYKNKLIRTALILTIEMGLFLIKENVYLNWELYLSPLILSKMERKCVKSVYLHYI
jgi:hypothetical protein